ncbi:MAG TPA: hypothetical protein DCS93_15585 [Microscillaceae bacterium]|nr:hypothetical protein [Microscillaceae bacterium]
MEVNIVIVVDVADYVASNGNAKYIHMIDNVPGSTGEAGSELHTQVVSGDTVRWSIVAVSPSDRIEITGFHPYSQGEHNYAFGRDGIANTPAKIAIPGSREYWATTILSRSSQDGQSFQYSVGFTANGKYHTYDPFLDVASHH